MSISNSISVWIFWIQCQMSLESMEPTSCQMWKKRPKNLLYIHTRFHSNTLLHSDVLGYSYLLLALYKVITNLCNFIVINQLKLSQKIFINIMSLQLNWIFNEIHLINSIILWHKKWIFLSRIGTSTSLYNKCAANVMQSISMRSSV